MRAECPPGGSPINTERAWARRAEAGQGVLWVVDDLPLEAVQAEIPHLRGALLQHESFAIRIQAAADQHTVLETQTKQILAYVAELHNRIVPLLQREEKRVARCNAQGIPRQVHLPQGLVGRQNHAQCSPEVVAQIVRRHIDICEGHGSVQSSAQFNAHDARQDVEPQVQVHETAAHGDRIQNGLDAVTKEAICQTQCQQRETLDDVGKTARSLL
eukprot:CAMPEP_0177449422 /NCGR_PEP_ID=MMETSP0369-20130122/8717_1 /TAXON_ID=447022 ORGANISM="Scrippsiella hangoei-like, Strain SHHI-4" /NCGR_SAMPLE_ID=MMETSP0369 /ASSEMBLY_ACC=CAM_ASM_000364 /LENGTH=214 /DNA_ID=CAMNT_0018921929 /DNA_START=10 /DNA_END=655 /DNA_ORIENTATION=+